MNWWDKEAVYQIYSKSFKDSNGDGIGDINGITQKLEYIKELGVGAIWICPLFDSPQLDGGYDISDYYSVYPPFGNTDDLTRLIDKAHSLGLRVIMDLVVNHTSDRHPWFLKSRKKWQIVPGGRQHELFRFAGGNSVGKRSAFGNAAQRIRYREPPRHHVGQPTFRAGRLSQRIHFMTPGAFHPNIRSLTSRLKLRKAVLGLFILSGERNFGCFLF